MKQRNVFTVLVCLLTVMLAFQAENIFAAPPPQADLNIEIQSSSSTIVRSPYVYTVNVENNGNANASNVKVVVEFPLTNTSPTQYILGNLSGIQNGCQVVSNKLECDLYTIKRNKNKSFTFVFEIPVSTQTPNFKANVSTTSNETILGNNTFTFTPTLAYPGNQIVSANILNSHCTGRNLSSYFECELFPSSISTHTATLNSGGTVSLPYPGYYGTWYQQTPQQLYFNYFDGNNQMAMEFNGFAVSANCFEGITTFPQNPTYNSAYKVCIQ